MANVELEDDEGDDREIRAPFVAILHRQLLGRDIPVSKQQDCVQTLTTLLQNVLQNPEDEKFRKIRCGNKTIRTKVLDVKGALEFLTAAGWRKKVIDFEPYLLLAPDTQPSEAQLKTLGAAIDVLTGCLKTVAEKAERHEREKLLEKEDNNIRREKAKQDIESDIIDRREKFQYK